MRKFSSANKPAVYEALTQKQEKAAKDAKVAAYWNREIERGQQQMVDEMFETGMNMLTVGDEKGAQQEFNDAEFFGMGIRPSQLPALKSQAGKTK